MLKEYLVACALMAVVAAILLPLPTFLIDLLLVLNLIFAVSLLILTLYVGDPVRISAFPSLLLLAALFRLSLNVSTTRAILSAGSAGKVIEAFGSLVVQGNLAVGVVVFLIITFVQFVVIAKGAERVAEVSARFSLDALPGRQMAIDADVRSGLYDLDTARQKRQELQTESRFYGALDGAMKFVKGDAIAGMLIVAVNIIGGLLTGVIAEGLDLHQAVFRYSLLTIGDGLITQLPSLLNSLAAGMVVTRVVRGDNVSLAVELVTQLGQMRKVQALGGSISIFLGILPGLPLLPFLIVGSFLLSKALLNAPDQARAEARRFRPKVPSLLCIGVSRAVGEKLATEKGFEAAAENFREKIFEETGLLLLPPELKLSDSMGQACSILLRGVAIEEFDLSEQSGATKSLFDRLERAVLARAGEMVDDITVRRIIDHFDADFPELVSSVIPSAISITRLTEILRNLAADGVPFRNLDLILQAIAECSGKGMTERQMSEEVRIALRRVICARHVTAGSVIHAITLDPVLDLLLMKAEEERTCLNQEMIAVIAGGIEETRQSSSGPIVLLVPRKARRILREHLELQDCIVPVVAYEEVVPEVNLRIQRCIKHEYGDRNEDVIEALAA